MVRLLELTRIVSLNIISKPIQYSLHDSGTVAKSSDSTDTKVSTQCHRTFQRFKRLYRDSHISGVDSRLHLCLREHGAFGQTRTDSVKLTELAQTGGHAWGHLNTGGTSEAYRVLRVIVKSRIHHTPRTHTSDCAFFTEVVDLGTSGQCILTELLEIVNSSLHGILVRLQARRDDHIHQLRLELSVTRQPRRRTIQGTVVQSVKLLPLSEVGRHIQFNVRLTTELWHLTSHLSGVNCQLHNSSTTRLGRIHARTVGSEELSGAKRRLLRVHPAGLIGNHIQDAVHEEAAFVRSRQVTEESIEHSLLSKRVPVLHHQLSSLISYKDRQDAVDLSFIKVEVLVSHRVERIRPSGVRLTERRKLSPRCFQALSGVFNTRSSFCSSLLGFIELPNERSAGITLSHVRGS